MFYEPDRSRRRKRKRRPGCLGSLIRLLLLAAAAYVVITVATTTTLSGVFSGLIPDGLPGGWRNVLLLGLDQVSGNAERSDSMMVASISTTGEVKLTSIMRDTLVPVGDKGLRKINAAYALGGAELAMDTVNRYFALNIRQYAAIDFEGFARVIDAMGGVQVDVTRAEAQAMNQKKGHKLKSYGPDTQLNGVQALRYARLRKIDSDYARTERQREVIQAMVNKARTIKNPLKLIELGKICLQAIDTNISKVDMALVAARVLLKGAPVGQFRVPAEGTYESGVQDGVWSIRADQEQNQKLLHGFIYG